MTATAAGVDPLALAQAATSVAGDRPVLEVALELAGAARQLEDLLARLDDCARFAATIEAADLEASSTRLLVTVRTHPDADPEQLRTDRTDGTWGPVIADRVRRHLGRRVLIHKLLEDAGESRKVRVLVWFDVLDDDATPAPGPPTVMPPASRPPGPAEQPTLMPPAAPAPAADDDPDADRRDLVARVLGTVDDASIPREHLAALLEAHYAGAAAVEDLDEDQLGRLARSLMNAAGVQRLRTAAARAYADAQQPRCADCSKPSPDLDADGRCPTCAIPF